MSTEKTSTPQQDTQATEKRQITVEVPEDRVEQFQALYERFLAAGEYGRRGHGRGRHGGQRRRHIRRAMYHLAMAEHGSGPEHGSCGRRRGAEDTSAAESTQTVQI
jgi:hypothetical protein